MKKILTILLSLAMIVGLCACGSEKQTENNEKGNTDTNIESIVEEVDDEKEDESEENMEDWGVQEKIVAKKNDTFTTAYIKFPTLSGITEGTGKIAYQKDNTLVILDAEHKDVFPNVTASSCEDVFPAYFEQTKSIIDAYRQMDYDNFEFNVSNKETVTVNGYEMCKYTGKHTFTIDTYSDEGTIDCEMNFVAYATKLNGNGVYVYWMVLDESEDQSLSKTIEEYADKMAKTLHE